MFEPVTQNLNQMLMFSILGFILGGLYEPLRIGRLFVKTGAVVVGIQDFLFLALSGLIVFAYSLEFGMGHFRFFYLIGIAFGGAVYFLTLGKIINILTKMFSNLIKKTIYAITSRIKRWILLPLWKCVVKIAQKLRYNFVEINKVTQKRYLLLKSDMQMRYNIKGVTNQSKAKIAETALRTVKKKMNDRGKPNASNTSQEVRGPVIRAKVTKTK
ncbi:MAG: spore cortex biosynthesis protein YabQ [Oscillospiraceae bacterium]|nr:spore cortex biosynthesis protein YabQ [Oscillospiraceae bacterium]